MAERMADHIVGHHPTMPGAGKTAQAVAATRRLENSLHAYLMTIVPCPLRLADRGSLPAFREHDSQSLVPSGASPTSEVPKVGMKP